MASHPPPMENLVAPGYSQGLAHNDSEVKKLLALLSKVIVAVLLGIVIVSLLASFLTGQSFLGTFVALLFWGGLVIVILSALVGAGFSEVGYYRSHLMVVSGTYQRAITRDRIQRRDEQFLFMMLGVGSGLLLIALSALANLLG